MGAREVGKSGVPTKDDDPALLSSRPSVRQEPGSRQIHSMPSRPLETSGSKVQTLSSYVIVFRRAESPALPSSAEMQSARTRTHLSRAMVVM